MTPYSKPNKLPALNYAFGVCTNLICGVLIENLTFSPMEMFSMPEMMFSLLMISFKGMISVSFLTKFEKNDKLFGRRLIGCVFTVFTSLSPPEILAREVTDFHWLVLQNLRYVISLLRQL